jgi:acetyl esterase/lipase
MAYELDAELLAEISARFAGGGMRLPQPAARGDWKTVRAGGEAALAAIEATLPEHSEVTRTAYSATSYDAAQVALRWYTPAGHDPSHAGPAAVYLHGGGMICAPEHPHPCPVEDSYAGLAWLAAHGGELSIDASRIALMGDSGGGGLAAAAALLARDRDLAVAKQILIYPMLDDRTTVPDPGLVPFAGWSYDDNYTGWHALLGEKIGTADVPGTAAPSRATDLTGLPPLYLDVGELDIFRDESIDYARRVAAAGTSVELHVHPGCPHGFDRAAPGAAVARRSRTDRIRALRV